MHMILDPAEEEPKIRPERDVCVESFLCPEHGRGKLHFPGWVWMEGHSSLLAKKETMWKSTEEELVP